MNTILGQSEIKATVICDSVSESSVRIVTWEIEYPRIIHAELMTHRMFSRNAASSRAIPFAKMAAQLEGKPVRFGANVSGMQDSGEHDRLVEGRLVELVEPFDLCGQLTSDHTPCYDASEAWEEAKKDALFWAKAFSDAGYHKQIFNRLTEPFQMMKTVVSATEFANFFWLRNDEAADPTLQELARCMLESLEASKPNTLKDGEWHLPYVDFMYAGLDVGKISYHIEGHGALTTEEAIKVSAARCAAVSYRNEDYTLEKCIGLYERLVGADKKHSSALEHQATPIKNAFYGGSGSSWTEDVNIWNEPDTWEVGISHMDKYGHLWSGNFRGWVQHRKTIAGENYTL